MVIQLMSIILSKEILPKEFEITLDGYGHTL